ncbi:valine--tRNA ligase [Candidatus Kaiserbacteria bacterium RIFCSPHIGHO2_02_FULL_50_50]|uniref:Valine--tRNA ligase n=1 Tax=Candidatus Kaiserbacteria bacterium RIFCSPHIGHO2_02_FULL_50_50 TaxID=1798492 RepID=A0A1F6DFR0_9BACT|nr:MAG: valine--tRNA ligase [Candidatus Kaiserbacteria bacterium RIFCSPHIGHO2_02_FULL_50_50]OGG88861.1 MAG: valine--tRNA ligase [Candidatus Kaiserbacteria bacterium RIFCSPLOWO2_12_FULL_50_10]
MNEGQLKGSAPEIFSSAYNHLEHEDTRYKEWEASALFSPDTCIAEGIAAPDAETFSIVLPPPNVTGTLHVGHASMLAIQDILVRYHRMRGHRTLWIPGTDSAALATQSKVEEIIYKAEKKTRHDIGREELLVRIDAFAKESEATILGQTRKMGSSLDWSRYAFTMDEARNKAVTEAFVRMYEKGLIYRGSRIVNWDPNLQTTVSDDEIEYKEETTKFYYLKYGPFTIGTSRPETKFGDKYVVMHPDDARYAEYTHGQKITVEWINGEVEATIIKDEAIDPEFGTGVMTITPWHSAVDFEIAERHGLSREQIIDERGILLPIAGEFAGQHIKKARAALIEKLAAKGLVEKVDEAYVHNLALNSRGGGTIEPQIKAQWFIGVEKPFIIEHSEISGVPSGSEVTLKSLMKAAVQFGDVTIAPDRFDKIYYHWINNLRDWCISRQIWYGHRIPVWYKGDEIFVGTAAPEGEGWTQESDTLDTWFSSGLWTFSTLGWPEQTADLKNYHPTAVLETGYDILFFWVARMVLMSTFLLGQVPFKNVYLHGLVRDEKGRKMSKSLGNIVNPLDLIEKYGADALRMGLILGAAPGNDLNLSEQKIKGYKHFANKMWNITRMILMNTDVSLYAKRAAVAQHPRDTEILAQLDATHAEITAHMEAFELHLAAEKFYHYVWHELADQILEESKEVLHGEDAGAREARAVALMQVLLKTLTMLHPFMPFLTETIYQNLPEELREEKFLMVRKW